MPNVTQSEQVSYGRLTIGLQGSLGVGGPNSIGTTAIKKPGVGSENIMNNTIGSKQLDSPGRGPYPGIEAYKLAEIYEHGTITGVTATGRYKSFSDTIVNPHVIVTGIGATIYLAVAPAMGSFKVQCSAAGTSNADYHVWGARS